MITRIYYAIVRFIEKGLFVPAGKNEFIGAPMQEIDAETHFQNLQNKRKPFIQAILESFPMKDWSFCSIGAGFGGEEYLLIDKTKELVLIEPSAFCYDFLIRKFQNKAVVSPKSMQHFSSNNKFDIIYAASPTNWMHQHPADGMPHDFINFLDLYLKDQGVFVARTYGGLHIREIVGTRLFFNTVVRTLKPKYKLYSGYFKYDDHQSTHVIVRNNFVPTPEFNKFVKALESCEGGVKFINGAFVGQQETSLLKKLYVFIKLTLYVPMKLFRETLRSLKLIVRDITTNLKIN